MSASPANAFFFGGVGLVLRTDVLVSDTAGVTQMFVSDNALLFVLLRKFASVHFIK